MLSKWSKWKVYNIWSWLYFSLLTTQRTAFFFSSPPSSLPTLNSFFLPFLCIKSFFFPCLFSCGLRHPRSHRWHAWLRRAADPPVNTFMTVQGTSIRRNCCVRLHAIRFRKLLPWLPVNSTISLKLRPSNPNTCSFYGNSPRHLGERSGQLHMLSCWDRIISVQILYIMLWLSCLSWILMNTWINWRIYQKKKFYSTETCLHYHI